MQALLLTLALCQCDDRPPARYQRMPRAGREVPPPGVREDVEDEAARQWRRSLEHFRRRQEQLDSDVDDLRARGWRGRFSWEEGGREEGTADGESYRRRPDALHPVRAPARRLGTSGMPALLG